VWQSDGRSNTSVPAVFVLQCLTGSTVAPFPQGPRWFEWARVVPRLSTGPYRNSVGANASRFAAKSVSVRRAVPRESSLLAAPLKCRRKAPAVPLVLSHRPPRRLSDACRQTPSVGITLTNFHSQAVIRTLRLYPLEIARSLSTPYPSNRTGGMHASGSWTRHIRLLDKTSSLRPLQVSPNLAQGMSPKGLPNIAGAIVIVIIGQSSWCANNIGWD